MGDSGLEILLGEGGDVELGARTSKHTLAFAFDPLSLNSLSLHLCIASFILSYLICLHLCLALFHIAISFICLVCLCVPHLYLTTRASYSTSTHFKGNQEELVQSTSRGIRLHLSVVLSV